MRRGLVGWRQHRRREAVLEALATERAQDAREARELLEVVVDATPAALLVLDATSGSCAPTAWPSASTAARLVGGRCYDALAGPQRALRGVPGPRDLRDGARVHTASGVHTDPRTGEVLAVESHPLRLPDGQDYVLLVERVVTEQKKLQARLLHQEKMAAFGLLAAGVAHEMGNPLASIEAQLQLLDEGRLGGRRRPRRGHGAPGGGPARAASCARWWTSRGAAATRRRWSPCSRWCGDALRLLRHDPRMRARHARARSSTPRRRRCSWSRTT